MKRILKITKMMLKTSSNPFEGLNTKANAKKMGIGMKIFIGFTLLIGFGSVGYLFVEMVISITDYLLNLNQAMFAVHLYLTAIVFMTIFFGIIITPAVYYFDETIERFLVLPISQRDYLAAKWINNALNVSMITTPFSILFTLTFGIKAGLLWYQFIYLLIATLIVPIIPISAIVFVIVLLFKAMPFIRNKNLYVYFSTFMSVIMAIGINIALGGVSENADVLATIMEGLQGNNNSMLGIVGSIVPSIPLFLKTLTTGNILYFIAAIAVTIAVIWLTILFTQYNYLESALSMSESGQSTKKLSDEKFNKTSGQRSKFNALMHSDFRNIMRTPIYASNYLMPLVIIPIGMLGAVFTSGVELSEFAEMGATLKEALEFINYWEVLPYVILGAIAVGYFMGSFTTITSTSISREGSNMQNLLLMPIELKHVIYSKILLGIIITSISPLFIIVAAQILFGLPIGLFVVVTLGVLVGVTTANINGILLDVIKPKLVWNNEQEAIKQNMLSVVPMFLSFAFMALTVIILLNFEALMATLLVSAMLILTAVLTLLYIRNKGVKHLVENIQAM